MRPTFNPLLVGILVLLANCGDSLPTVLIPPPEDLPPNLEEQFTLSLQGTWSIGPNGHVQRDTLDLTSQYSDFEVTFIDTAFSTAGDPAFWPSPQGRWAYLSQDSVLIGPTTMGVNLTLSELSLTYDLAGTVDTIPDTTFLFHYQVDLRR